MFLFRSIKALLYESLLPIFGFSITLLRTNLVVSTSLISNNEDRLEKNIWSDLGLGEKVKIIEGFAGNIKITESLDLKLAEMILSLREVSCV